MTSEPTVRMTHVREAKLCARGARAWVDTHGFSWSDFLRDGLTVVRLQETGDAAVYQVIALAERDFRDGK